MKRFRKIYVEISNLCNLRCSFCPGTSRKPGWMGLEDFDRVLRAISPYTDHVYFHLMGEPLCHPALRDMLRRTGQAGLRGIITTNGTLLSRNTDLLELPGLHKVNISLHAFEANDLTMPFEAYLQDCFRFGQLAQGRTLIVYRLWNQGGAEELNNRILEGLREAFPGPWAQERHGTRLADRVYLEYGEKFEWPDLKAPEGSDRIFCYGLRDQLGILWDGTVVPCCLDHEGDIPLGNIFTQELGDILESPRAQAIYQGFQKGSAPEELCRRCGYARRFTR